MSATTQVIGPFTVTRRAQDWHACLTGHTGMWGCGPTIPHAIGEVVLAHAAAVTVAGPTHSHSMVAVHVERVPPNEDEFVPAGEDAGTYALYWSPPQRAQHGDFIGTLSSGQASRLSRDLGAALGKQQYRTIRRFLDDTPVVSQETDSAAKARGWAADERALAEHEGGGTTGCVVTVQCRVATDWEDITDEALAAGVAAEARPE